VAKVAMTADDNCHPSSFIVWLVGWFWP